MRVKVAGRDMELNIEERLKKQVRGPLRQRVVADSGDSKVPTISPSPHHPYKNKLEKAFAQQLDAEWKAGVIQGWLYEPFTFKLAEGKRYRVDFITWGEEGTVCYEVKGWHANIRDSLTHLKWATQRFPFFKWRKAIRKGGGFEHMDIVV
jgi:hypothetical protein